MGIKAVYNSIKTTLNASEPFRYYDVVLDDAIFNPSRKKNNICRFPCDLYTFGYSQTDAAGVLAPLYYFAIIGKMRPYEEFSQREDDVLDVVDSIVSQLHRKRFDNHSTIFSKVFIFHSTMTLTNDNRRVSVKLDDGEIGFGVFFYASPLTVKALAETATVTHTTDENTAWAAETVSTNDQALATKTRSVASSLF